MISISLRHLPLPCPANRLHGVMRVTKGSRTYPMKILSKEARQKKRVLVAAIMQQLGGMGPRIAGPCQMTFTVTPATKRTPDWDAYIKQLCDCLQAAGVVVDDKYICAGSGERLPVAKMPGWIDLEIWELPDARVAEVRS